jgi:hypothetical protein
LPVLLPLPLLAPPLLAPPLEPGERWLLEPDMPPDELPPVEPLPADDPLVLPLPALPLLPPRSQPVTRVPATASAKTTDKIRFIESPFVNPTLCNKCATRRRARYPRSLDKSRAGTYW